MFGQEFSTCHLLGIWRSSDDAEVDVRLGCDLEFVGHGKARNHGAAAYMYFEMRRAESWNKEIKSKFWEQRAVQRHEHTTTSFEQ